MLRYMYFINVAVVFVPTLIYTGHNCYQIIMRKTEIIEEIWDEDRQRLYERKPPPKEITRQEKLKKLWVDYLRISPVMN